MGKSSHSRGSEFLHDLITVDFDKVDVYAGVRVVTVIALLLVLELITKRESSLVILGTAFVLGADEFLPTSQRTRTLLSVSVIIASSVAIGMLASMANYLVIPLLTLGLFLMSYFRVLFPGGSPVLMWGALLFAIGVITQGTTLALIGQAFLLVILGGLWVILIGVIFPAHKHLKPHTTTKQSVPRQSVQEQTPRQSPAKLTRQDRYKLFTSNLSIHSQYFQSALTLALTSAVGVLIAQWFELKEPEWILITTVVILMPVHFDISLTFTKVVHRIIGTFIGAIIAILIISTIENQLLLTLLMFLFAGVFISLIKTRNYAFQVIFMTVFVLLLVDIPNPSTDPNTSFIRLQNIIIGSLLSLLAAFIVGIVPKAKSNRALGSIRE